MADINKEAVMEQEVSERQEELMLKAVSGTATEEELLELAEDYGLGLTEEPVADGEDKEDEGIPYNLEIIGAYEECSSPDPTEYDKGVVEASKYLGIMHTLINGGIASQDAMVVASWIYNDGINDKTIAGGLENTKLQGAIQQRQGL